MAALTNGSWLPLADLVAHLGIATGQQPQTGNADRARLAAAAHVEGLRPDLLVSTTTTNADGSTTTTTTFAAPPQVRFAGVLLAARLYARQGSPAGLASYGEFGPAAVLRLDPDVERLLGVGRHARPVAR